MDDKMRFEVEVKEGDDDGLVDAVVAQISEALVGDDDDDDPQCSVPQMEAPSDFPPGKPMGVVVKGASASGRRVVIVKE